MSNLILTETRLQDGVWQARVTGPRGDATTPEIHVHHLDQPVAGVTLERSGAGNAWKLSFPLPAAAMSDGVQTILITDARDGSRLGEVTLIAGQATEGDLRAELGLLRAELDLLKRAFRQHCRDTGAT